MSPFLFQFFAGWLKLFSLIINELDTTFKNSSKFIWSNQNKSSIFVLSNSMKGLFKTKIKMKNLSKKAIAQVREIKAWNSTRFHGNRKTIGELTIEQFKEIVAKKSAREYSKIDFAKKTPAQLVRELINRSQESIHTNYFKTMIEGSTGIYYAHPYYGHSDYNKSRLFDKTPETMKLMYLFNSYFSRKIKIAA